jgi:phosphatidylethanolamine-binding protein (PEBP) family uncharacterized protein
MDSEKPGKDGKEAKSKTHWVVYDIPKEVSELRDELSGSGSSDVARLGMKDDAGQAPVVVDPMGQIDGWVDPEIEAMQKMIHGALDASFEERNRAKEGANSFGGTYYRGPTKKGATTSFKLYALSGRLELPKGSSKEEVSCAACSTDPPPSPVPPLHGLLYHHLQVTKAMKGKVLSKATLTATV